MRLARLATVVATSGVGGLLLSGCTGNSLPDPEQLDAPANSAPASADASPGASPSATAADPQLEWKVLSASRDGERTEAVTPDYRVSRSRDGTKVIARDGDAQEVRYTYSAPAGFEVNQVFLEPPTLVVVTADPTEEQDDRVAVIDLRTQEERGLAETAPDIWMGSWSLGKRVLTYGARGPKGEYCLAAVHLDTLNGEFVECVPPRHGVQQVKQAPAGLAYARFDDSRPRPCATLRVRRGAKEPVDADGPAECRSWDAIPVDGGLVWTEVPRPREIEVAEVRVRTGDAGTQFLGYATTGSLVWCGDYVWFTRQMEGRIMRWSPEAGLEIAFEMPDTSKVSVLSMPLCSGDSVAFIEASDAPGPGNRTVPYTTRATD